MRPRIKAILERNKRLRAQVSLEAWDAERRARSVTFMTVPEMPTPSVETGDRAFEHPARLCGGEHIIRARA